MLKAQLRRPHANNISGSAGAEANSSGGNGGQGGIGIGRPGGIGGKGGNAEGATATATANIVSGSAGAEANSSGGNGGQGSGNRTSEFGGGGGDGGATTATAASTALAGSAEAHARAAEEMAAMAAKSAKTVRAQPDGGGEGGIATSTATDRYSPRDPRQQTPVLRAVMAAKAAWEEAAVRMAAVAERPLRRRRRQAAPGGGPHRPRARPVARVARASTPRLAMGAAAARPSRIARLHQVAWGVLSPSRLRPGGAGAATLSGDFWILGAVEGRPEASSTAISTQCRRARSLRQFRPAARAAVLLRINIC